MQVLEGKVAAVTGGSRGIGRGLVEAFLREGAMVAFNGRDTKKGEQALAELCAGDRAVFVQGDARNSADVKRLVDTAVERWGRLDIMVNNAGGSTRPAPTAQLDDDAWENDIRWNLSGVFYGTKWALQQMIPRGWGRIINISSVEGKQGAAGMAGYVAAKHGVNGLTKTAALEVGRLGITCNAICPGLIITDAVRDSGDATAKAMGLSGLDEMVEKIFKAKTATGEINTVEQVAAVAVLLASDVGAGITGACISVDCGTAQY